MISAALSVIEDEKQRNELAIFYEKYKNRFFNIARSKTNDPDESEDAVQEAFTRIAKKPERFFNITASEERLRYVDGIVRHIAIDIFNKRTKTKTISLDEMDEDIPSENISPEEKYVTDVSADDIVKFTLTLPENQRQALFMYELINVYAGRPNTLTSNYGISLVGSNNGVRNGITQMYPYSTETQIQVNGTTKYVKRASHANIYFANKITGGTYTGIDNSVSIQYNSRSTTGHQNTIKHELGHALGYSGHSTSTSDIMTTTTSNTNAMNVSTHDRLHLYQIIDSFVYSSTNSNGIAENLLSAENNTGNVEFVEHTASFVNNIITATPIQILQGSLDSLDESEEDCEYLLTEYQFKVTGYDYGFEGEDIITVRSQVGNIFELGKEYTFSAERINNTLFDLYTVNSRKWVVDHENYNPKEISEFRSTLNKIETERKEKCISTQIPKVVETAEATKEFIGNNVDIAFIAKITEIEEDEQNDIHDIKVSDIKYLKGSVKKDILNNGLRIKGDIEIGGTYLMLFTEESDEYIMMSARNNSIIDVNSSEYDKFAKALKVI